MLLNQLLNVPASLSHPPGPALRHAFTLNSGTSCLSSIFSPSPSHRTNCAFPGNWKFPSLQAEWCDQIPLSNVQDGAAAVLPRTRVR
jgi:hypothetical protein